MDLSVANKGTCMGLTATGTGIVTGAGGGGLSAVAEVGTAIASVFATVALIYTLAYIYLVDAMKGDHDRLQRTLKAAIIPLGVVFISIVLYEVTKVIQA